VNCGYNQQQIQRTNNVKYLIAKVWRHDYVTAKQNTNETGADQFIINNTLALRAINKNISEKLKYYNVTTKQKNAYLA
jgi:hypothetical protein